MNRHTLSLSLELASLDDILKDLNDIMPESTTNFKSTLKVSVSLPPRRCTLEEESKGGIRRNRQCARTPTRKYFIGTEPGCDLNSDQPKDNIVETLGSPISSVSMTNMVEVGIKELNLSSMRMN